MGNKSLTMMACVFVFCVATIASPGPTFKTAANFSAGAFPYYGSLVQGLDGNFYGTTARGNYYGSVFKMTPSGTLTTLYTFCSVFEDGLCQDGSVPITGLVLATNGNFYGTTLGGGAYDAGTVFEITSAGKLTTLYSFCSQGGTQCTDGSTQMGTLIQAANGALYGTTYSGGANGLGEVFEITTQGNFKVLYSFCSVVEGGECQDGEGPEAGLIQATNGNFYGTTGSGGAYANGIVFEITAGGKLTTLYSFCSQANCTDGYYPTAALVQASDGNFYGTTDGGGAQDDGTVFEITAAGKLTTLHSFCSQSGCADGQNTFSALVQGTNGEFYGTTLFGGDPSCDCGEIFEITASGAFTTLHDFTGPDGSSPYAAPMQGTNGKFYGTTSEGGANLGGTIYELCDLSPFVEALPTSGKAGATVKILGNKLNGATSVSFNGTAATFTVVRNTEIVATVPTGATNGHLEVVTSTGKTLKSNVVFRVIQ